MSPSEYNYNGAEMYRMHRSGYNYHSTYLYTEQGLRPVISLAYGVGFSSGNGSKDNPYVIADNYTITNSNANVKVQSIGHKGDKVTLTPTSNQEIVSFKVNGTTVTDNYFIMPNTNVTITDVVLS